MSRLIHKCNPANQDKLNCPHLAVMRMGNQCCFHRTKNGYCARLHEREVKEAVDKLGQLEEQAVNKC